jgi:hypothetical protein
MGRELPLDKHFKYQEAKRGITVESHVDFICGICKMQKKCVRGRLEYTRPKTEMNYYVTFCCGTLVCSDCADSKLLKRCHVCSKDTNIGWQNKRGSGWKSTYREYVVFHKMWQVKPFLGPFCSTNFNGLWRNIVKIIQDGNQQKIEALEKRYIRFVNETFRKQYLFFTLRTSFNFLPFVRKISQMQSWYNVLRNLRQYTIRRRNILNMFQNGFVKMLGKKFSEEKEFTKFGVEIKFRRNFFLRILKRILSKRNQ